MHPIKAILSGNSKYDQNGLCSVCSASDFVIEAALSRAKETNTLALIEATANQVNQFGGYTGMFPEDFARKVLDIANKIGLDPGQVALGGDHLGPYPWRNEGEASVMGKAARLISEYVKAGFTKIHIDTSMRLKSDDANRPLDVEVIAKRAAELAKAAMDSRLAGCEYVFVLGSEVPVPGGLSGAEPASVTSPESFRETHDCFSQVFSQRGLPEIWRDVIAFVVQPGVEFDETEMHPYDRRDAKTLCNALRDYPGICFEGHSTDYQPKGKLKEMVEDGVRILKVGPALTFHQREALFSLEMIEKELLSGGKGKLSNFAETLEGAMLENPSYWEGYYRGSEGQKRLMRRFSLSDRCRYYLSRSDVAGATEKLIANLDSVKIPLALLSQYMPVQASLVNSGEIGSDAKSLILSRITCCIDDYLEAITGRQSL